MIKAEHDIIELDRIWISHNISKDWTMDQYHFHDHYEINLCISGGNRFFVNNHCYNAKPGDLFLFNSNDLHKNISPSNFDYERYLVFFNPIIFNSLKMYKTDILSLFHANRNDFINYIHLTTEQLLELRQKLDELLFYYHQELYGKDILLFTRLCELIILINCYYYETEVQNTHVPVNGLNKIQPILSYIDNHLNQSLTLDLLASTFFINKYYLCELFKDVTGFTVNQYLTNKRILKARVLLKQGMSVSMTAQAVGYTNDSHFIRTFKKLVGITPKQYALK